MSSMEAEPLDDDVGFEFFETTADIGFSLFAKDLAGIFEQAGRALFSIMTDLSMVEVRELYAITLEASTREDLLVAWLSELLYLSAVHHAFFSGFQILRIDDCSLIASVGGESIDPHRHPLDGEVKAVTYHGLKIELSERYTASVIVDL